MSDLKIISRDSSQLDPGQIIKSQNDDYKQAQRTLDIKEFDRLEVTYDSNGNMETVTYYQDRLQSIFEVGFPSDSGGSLNDTYWLLNGPKNKEKYYVWYSVDGGGTDPSIANRTGIQVDIATGDAGAIVALATLQQLNLQSDLNYTVTQKNAVLTFNALVRGVTDDPSNISTGVVVSNVQQGSEVQLRKLYLEYDASGCLISYSAVEQNVGC